MLIFNKFKIKIPEFLKQILRPFSNRLIKKNVAELSFWRSRLKIDNGKFDNSNYERLMLLMAEEPNDNLKEK